MKEKTVKAHRRYLPLLLAVAISITAQAMPVLAETNSGRASSNSGETPSNPVHHCTRQVDGSDITDWSYVYFGSYPQTEVTGDALALDIMDAPYDENGDAWVDGIKYRRISESDTNYHGYFGDAQYRYFKWEQIKWRVLRNDGSTLFLMADKGLDCKNYNETFAPITWEGCTLRDWLNGGFYETAFSSGEQEAIVAQEVVNEDNPYYGTEGGKDTRDNVYLLSIGEVTDPAYGFCRDSDTNSASRWIQASDYAHAMGVNIDNNGAYRGNSLWWLRSPGQYASAVADTHEMGSVYQGGFSANNVSVACVPALHINLSSNLWSLADDGTIGEEEPSGTDISIFGTPGSNKGTNLHRERK